jgi:hypothetical protein
MMRRIAILLFTFFLIAGNLTAQRNDKKKSASELGIFNGGVLYSLPRTGIRVVVEVTQEKFFRGPYSEYAQKYLGVKNAATSDAEVWKINDLKIETFGEPDPAEMHKASGAIASMLSLSENGVLIGINSSVKGEPAVTYTSVFTPDIEIPREIWPDVTMQSFFAGKDSLNQSGGKLKSLEQKAAEAASDILTLRERKVVVLEADDNPLPPDGKAYQVMVDELNKIMAEYESLFIGKSYKSTHKYVFEVVPDTKGSKAIVAFRFSASSGILPESNVSGKPIMLELDSNADLVRNGEQKAAPVAGETSSNGLFYRTPGIVVARLLNGSDVLAQARLSMAQFGVVTPVPDGLTSGEYSIEFHPVTGAIKRIGN